MRVIALFSTAGMSGHFQHHYISATAFTQESFAAFKEEVLFFFSLKFRQDVRLSAF